MQLRTYAALAVLWAATVALPVAAAILPEDRADAMLHYYDGGGTRVDGPALLVRKSFAEQASVSASYYTDSISGASIDVVTTASPYKEKRKELGVGMDLVHRNTTMSFSYSTSDEPDYLSSTLGLNISHELFDGLTTFSLGYLVGHDQVGKTGTSFEDNIDRYNYKLGWSQIFTRSLLMSLEYEGVVEVGYLNSPYRAARLQGLLVPEVYPRTRDTYAVALRTKKGFGTESGELGSSLHLGYRYFWDTWDVQAHTIELGYQKKLDTRWTLEPRYRYYRQSAASFYSDNFATAMNFMARDKELSTFTSHSLGIKAGYRVFEGASGTHGSLNGSYDYLYFDYDDFTDTRSGEAYAFGANVVQLFFSVWY